SLLPSTARLLVQDNSAGGSEQGEGAEGSNQELLASLGAFGVGSGGLSEGGGGVESGSEEEGGEGLALSMAAWVQVPANHVRPGDRVLVLPGDVIPVDGLVECGRSAVDESLQTGEAATVPKRRGTTVAAGTVNWEGPIVVSATATGASCAVCEMARRVEDAQQRTAPVQRLADAIAGPFVFTIMTLSAATFAFWYTVGVHLYPAVLLSDFAGDDSDPLVLSLRLAISVLVVACPCALGLATPTAILVGTSLGARRGLLLRGGDVLERLAAVDVVAFDKTGTLTAGQPQVSAVVPAAHLPPTTLNHSPSHSTSLHQDPAKASSHRHTTTTATAVATNADTATDTATVSLLRLAAAAEATTRHPVAAAITTHAARLSAAPLPPVSSALTVPGRGVVALVDGREIHVGGFDWVAKHCLGGTREREGKGGSGKGSEVEGEKERWQRVEEGVLRGECGGVGGSGEGGDGGSRDSSSSHTFVYVGETRSEEERRGAAEEGRSVGGILGCICVSDSLRAEAQQTVSRLESLGVSAAVLSGDRQAAVSHVAEAVGIAGQGKVLGRLLPEGKAEAIESMQRDGHSVAMVGDGINDTLALARADVGVAVPPPGATSAVMSAAADAADLVLLGNRLTQLVEAVHLARATMNRVRLNLAWALTYNCPSPPPPCVCRAALLSPSLPLQLVEAVHLARATMNRVRLNLAWALAYNCLAVPLAAGAFLPAYDIALTPTLAGTPLGSILSPPLTSLSHARLLVWGPHGWELCAGGGQLAAAATAQGTAVNHSAPQSPLMRARQHCAEIHGMTPPHMPPSAPPLPSNPCLLAPHFSLHPQYPPSPSRVLRAGLPINAHQAALRGDSRGIRAGWARLGGRGEEEAEEVAELERETGGVGADGGEKGEGDGIEGVGEEGDVPTVTHMYRHIRQAFLERQAAMREWKRGAERSGLNGEQGAGKEKRVGAVAGVTGVAGNGNGNVAVGGGAGGGAAADGPPAKRRREDEEDQGTGVTGAVADGVMTDGTVADGVMTDGTVADGAAVVIGSHIFLTFLLVPPTSVSLPLSSLPSLPSLSPLPSPLSPLPSPLSPLPSPLSPLPSPLSPLPSPLSPLPSPLSPLPSPLSPLPSPLSPLPSPLSPLPSPLSPLPSPLSPLPSPLSPLPSPLSPLPSPLSPLPSPLSPLPSPLSPLPSPLSPLPSPLPLIDAYIFTSFSRPVAEFNIQPGLCSTAAARSQWFHWRSLTQPCSTHQSLLTSPPVLFTAPSSTHAAPPYSLHTPFHLSALPLQVTHTALLYPSVAAHISSCPPHCPLCTPSSTHPTPSSTHPTPSSTHPTPSSTHPTPSSTHPTPSSTHPTPSSTHPTPSSTHPTPSSTHPTPSSTHPTPSSTHPTPSSTHPTPSSTHPTPSSTHPTPSSTHPTPSSTHPTPSSTHPTPSSTHPTPSSTHPTPSSTHPTPSSTHPTPSSTHPTPSSTHPTPLLHSTHPTPFSTHPTPSSTHPTPSSTHPTPSSTHPTPSSTHPTPSSTHPTPSSTHPTPSSTHPTPSSTHPTPSSTHPTPSSTHPTPSSTHPTPSSTHPTPSSTHPTPSSTHPTPSSTHPTPSSTHPTPSSAQATPPPPSLATPSAPAANATQITNGAATAVAAATADASLTAPAASAGGCVGCYRGRKLRQTVSALMHFFARTYLEVFGFQHPPLHDPCAVAFVIAPALFKAEHLRVDIETKSETEHLRVDIETKSEPSSFPHFPSSVVGRADGV
ncbi:unnamed protein product, partial [Closterium sp. Naga37s-1]